MDELGFSFVVFEQAPAGVPVVSVTADNRAGARQLVEHLLGRGHRRIAFISTRTPWPMVEERLRGYREALSAAGVAAPELEVAEGVWDPADGSQMTEQLLALAEPPTAIVCGNDLLALGAMRAARIRGLRIPEEVAIAGFNDFEFAQFADPPLTTVRVPGYDLGRVAAESLIGRLGGDEPPAAGGRLTLPVELSYRLRREEAALYRRRVAREPLRSHVREAQPMAAGRGRRRLRGRQCRRRGRCGRGRSSRAARLVEPPRRPARRDLPCCGGRPGRTGRGGRAGHDRRNGQAAARGPWRDSPRRDDPSLRCRRVLAPCRRGLRAVGPGPDALHAPAADRGRRTDHAVELPCRDPHVEARPGARVYGNTVVLKLGHEAPRTGLHLAECFAEAGLPPGVLNVLTGAGSEVGAELVRNADVRAISFTGSVAVGRSIREEATARNCRVQLELGGHNPLLVLADAELDRAVEAAYAGAFWSAGQKCTATRRIYVQDAAYGEFRTRFVERIAAGRVGDPADPATEVGPLVNEGALEDVLAAIARGQSEGGTVLAGGERAHEEAYIIAPTVFEGVADDAFLSCEEVFGPVTSLYRFSTLDEGLERANAVEFGLSAAIFTRDLRAVQRFTTEAQAGILHVNSQTAGADVHVPFGGIKGSGWGPHEQGRAAIEFYTELVTVYQDAPAD